MKKLVTILAVAAMLFSGFAFAAGGEKIDARIKAAFSNDFSGATAVSWKKVKNCYLATFSINNLELNAAYSEDGELVGTSRELESSLLPINVTMALGKKFEGYTVSSKALELTFDGETSYYLAVENDSQYLKLKCSAGGYTEVEKKIRKK